MRVDIHLKKAKHNKRCLQETGLANSEFLDWAVTIISYTALHYVDALLAQQYGTDPRNHGERSAILLRERTLDRNLRYDFESLKNDGVEARYTERIFTEDEVRNEIMPLLTNLKDYINQYVPLR